jgi:mRNA interferase MazF
VVISQGEVWWADLLDPVGSGPGYCSPIVVVQCDALNRNRIAAIVCVPLTSNLKWALAPGNLRLSPRQTGLPRDSVANVSQIVTLDKALLTKRVGKLPYQKLGLLLSGINLVLGK